MHPTNVPDLSARQLHAVLAVVEYNSFIAAAAFLKTSQPALTRTIKRVEDVLGVRLFDRSTRRVEITAAGIEAASFGAPTSRRSARNLDRMGTSWLLVGCGQAVVYSRLVTEIIQYFRGPTVDAVRYTQQTRDMVPDRHSVP
jgi:DNA-binding transcriptional LysR family regulator